MSRPLLVGMALVALAVLLKQYPTKPAPPDLFAVYQLVTYLAGLWRFGSPPWDAIVLTLVYLFASAVVIGWVTAGSGRKHRVRLLLTGIAVLSAALPAIDSVTVVLFLVPITLIAFVVLYLITLLVSRWIPVRTRTDPSEA